MRRGDRVCIEWDDILASLHTEEDIEPVRAETVGWIDGQSGTWIRLATTRYTEECGYRDLIVIPKGVIRKMVKI